MRVPASLVYRQCRDRLRFCLGWSGSDIADAACAQATAANSLRSAAVHFTAFETIDHAALLYAMAAIAAGAARHGVIGSKPLCGKQADQARVPGANVRLSAPLPNSDNSQRQNSLTSGF
jgi:hypothetical protein